MIPRMSKTAAEHLHIEARSGNFTQFTLEKIRIENQIFSQLANYIAQSSKSEYGATGYKIATVVFAYTYRAIELSILHRDKTLTPLIAQLSHDKTFPDLLESASSDDIARSLLETNELIARHTLKLF